MARRDGGERGVNDVRSASSSTDVEDESGEFRTFRDFTRNLMAVPRKELDEQERQYRNQNGNRRRPKPAD